MRNHLLLFVAIFLSGLCAQAQIEEQKDTAERFIRFSNEPSDDEILTSIEGPKKWTWYVEGSYGGLTNYFNKPQRQLEKNTKIQFQTYGAEIGFLLKVIEDQYLEGMVLSPYAGLGIGIMGYTSALKYGRILTLDSVIDNKNTEAVNPYAKDTLFNSFNGGYAYAKPMIGCRIGTQAFSVDFRFFYQVTSNNSITVVDRISQTELCQGYRHSGGICLGFWLYQHFYLGMQHEFHGDSFDFYSLQLGWGF